MSDELNNIPQDENNDEDIVELIDENGEKTLFEHLATLEYKGESYLALCDPDADDEDLEVFILKIDHHFDKLFTTPINTGIPVLPCTIA